MIHDHDGMFRPTLSVIIALKNEQGNVEKLVRALGSLNYSNEFEIILIDDHSTDRTWELLNEIQLPNLTVVKSNGTGKKQAILSGIHISKGDWIIQTDADCKMNPDWILAMVREITPETNLVMGPVFINPGNGFLNALQRIEFLALQGATAGSAMRNRPISANGANLMYRKSTFKKLQPFRSNLHIPTGDDQFILMEFFGSYPESIRYALRNDAIVQTEAVYTWSKYFEQRSRWASKGGNYQIGHIIRIGFLILMVNAMVSITTLFGILSLNWVVAVVPIGIKMCLDLLLILRMQKLSKEPLNYSHYLIAGFVYPFVVVITTVLGLTKAQSLKQP